MGKLVSWVEIPSVDFKRAVNFYNAVLQIDLAVLHYGEEKMACFPTGEGAISYTSEFKPSENGVLVSLNTKHNLDRSIIRVRENGGRIVQEKTKIQVEGCGHFALFIDCEGNRIGLYSDE